MKTIAICFFIFFSVLLVADLNSGREEVGEYWKRVMNKQPIPKAIEDLFYSNPSSGPGVEGDESVRFVKNFDPHPNAILYHTHPSSTQPKQKPMIHV